MKLSKKVLLGLVVAGILSSCAGFERTWSKSMATSFGADYLVIKNDMNGHPFRCWKLADVSVQNEESSDGIYWKDHGHLVHIVGNYDYVQVNNMDWKGAMTYLGLDDLECIN